MRVADILELQKFEPVILNPTGSLSDAVILMSEKDIGSIIIVNEDFELVGMLTFREVLRVLAKRQIEKRSGSTPTMSLIKISEVMNKNPTTTSLNMEIDELRRLMNDCGERYLPCIEKNKILGVVSFHDVARAMLTAQDFENKMLKAYIQDWPESESKEEK
jgi:CBS domain-containing protein